MNSDNMIAAGHSLLTRTPATFRTSGLSALRKFLSGLMAVTALLTARDMMATTYYSKAATGDPTALTSWTNSAGGNPADFTSGDTFVILSGNNYTIPFNVFWTVNATTAGTAATVQINSGGTLTLTLGTGSTCKLVLGGNFEKNGTVAGTATTTTGAFEFTSSGTWTGSGDISNVKANILVNAGVTLNASGMTSGFKLKSSNTVGITANGTLIMGANTISGNANVGASFVLGASGTLITASTNATGLPGIFTGFSASKITLPTTANYVFNGTDAQVTGTSGNNATLPATMNNLTFSNSAGVTLSQATTVNGALSLAAGKVTGNVTLGSTGILSGGSSSAYVNGTLTVPFTSPAATNFLFPIGTASAYSPIGLTNFTDSGTGTLTASATASQATNQASSGIDSSLYISRYWTLTGSGFTSPTYDFTGTYVAGDIQNGANPVNLIVRKWDQTSWAAPTSSTALGSPTYTVTGTGFSGTFGQFAAGEAATTMPILASTTQASITATSATLGATLVTNYTLAITDYGIVWGYAPNPTVTNNKVQIGTTTPTLGSPFSTNITGWPVATTVYYRGYAVSSGGTGYTTNASFSTLTNEPTVQASGAGATSLQNGSINFTWTRGNGAKCIVLVKSGSAVDAAPVDGTTYTANAAFTTGSQIGTGNYVTYLGTGTNVTLTGLSVSTTYYVAVYELNGAGGLENYLTASPATGSQTTLAVAISTLNWTGTASTDWNDTNNWDSFVIPGVGTAVVIPVAPGNQPVYASPMTGASVGALTCAGTLNVNTNGFNSGALALNNVSETGAGTGAKMYVGSGGVVNVSGAVALTSNAWLTVGSGGSLTASGALTLGSGSTVGCVGIVTNSGGVINVASTAVNSGNAAVSSAATSGNNLFVISGGINTLGSVTIGRSTTATGFNGIGKEGLVIYGGQVTMSGLNVGGGNGNSALSAVVAGGVVTNNGSVLVNQGTSGRGSRLLQTGGLFVVTNLVNPNPTVSGSLNIYSVTGGTNIIGGAYFGTGSSAGNVYFTNGATLYVGSQGMGWNSAVTLSSVLSGGSLLGAMADWTGSAPLQLDVGTATLQAADLNGVAHNITLTGVLSGSGALTKTGDGTVTLNAADTYLGNTTIRAGTLALGASGSLNNSGQISVESGAVYDVQSASSYTVPASKSLGGLGTVRGNVSFAATANLVPGTIASKGTLTFSNDIAITGTAITFEFSANPSSSDNDSVTVVGALNISGGGNLIDIIGAGPAGSVYPLFKYGSLTGGFTNLSLSAGAGSVGYLTNDTTSLPNRIAYVVTKTVHSSTNVAWVGNVTNNVWDSLTTTNWSINGSLEYFINGDSAIFSSAGQVNSNVVLNTTVLPAATTVDAAGDYVFSGSGSIGGSGGITKTNTGRLILQNTNSFTGGVNLRQGVISVSSLVSDNIPSPLGQTGTLLMDGGSLEYTGPGTSWTRLITLGTNGGGFSLPTSVALTYSGTLSGSGSLTKSDLGSLTLGTGNSYSGGTYLNAGTLTVTNATGAGTGNIVFTGDSTLALGAVKPANTIVLSNFSGLITGGNAGGATGIKNVVGSSNLLLSVTSGVFDLTGDMSAYSGTITFANAGGATVRFNGSASSVGSALATWDLGAGSMDLNVRISSTSNNIGALQGGSSTTLSGRGGSGNSGATTYYIGANNLNSTFDGVIQNGFGASGSVPNGNSATSINKIGSGTLTLNGVSTFSGTAVVNGGTLSGTGTISGATTMNPNTILSPGSGSIGTLTIGNNLDLSSDSTNLFVVTSAGGASNSVAVSGTLSPNGSIIKVTSGTALGVGTYTLFTYTAISGSFNAAPVFDVAPAATTATIVDTGSGQINLVLASGPSGPGYLTNSLSGSSLTLTWPAGESWRLVSQTNSLSTGLNPDSAAWSTVPGVSDGSATITIDPTQPTVFYQLVYP